jgi:hypothetical protein
LENVSIVKVTVNQKIMPLPPDLISILRYPQYNLLQKYSSLNALSHKRSSFLIFAGAAGQKKGRYTVHRVGNFFQVTRTAHREPTGLDSGLHRLAFM